MKNTDYPFKLKDEFEKKLGTRFRDGNYYIDVKVCGKWDGVLVVNQKLQCIGICCGGKNQEFSLPFEPEDIQDVRQASLWNMILSSIPEWIIFYYPYACIPLLPFFIMLDSVHPYLGESAIIFFGYIGQRIVISNMRAYCLTNLFIIIAIFGMQIAAVVNMLK